MREFNINPVSVILLDAYGTVVEIRDKRRPFRQLIQLGARQGRKPDVSDAVLLMSQPVNLRQAADLLGILLSDADYERLYNDLRAEIASITPFPEALFVLQSLRDRGFKVALCSNLMLDYAAPIAAVLPFVFDAYALSFETRAIKPNPAIYASVCQRLQCASDDVVMIGDSVKADVEGPREFGMQAFLLDRKLRFRNYDSIPSLSELVKIFDGSPSTAA
ncbi:HAD family hydrolase [Massilia phyllosphaerae]|uniref:HAD family hydrolase n=1 Tax=Massilia phyllosphaerae TaxID=3106034 RepID=UPI002B1CC24D|nr:HAD family hydrolase [Massilia sp. SGZ-792]